MKIFLCYMAITLIAIFLLAVATQVRQKKCSPDVPLNPGETCYVVIK